MSIILLLAMAATACTSIDKESSWEQDGLKGEVKTTKTIAYNVIDSVGIISKGEIMDDIYAYVLIKYNPAGEWTEYRSFNPDGTNRWAELPVFNGRGSFQERYDYTYSNSDSVLYRRFIYGYDKKDNMTKSLCFNGVDSLIARSVYKYDSKGMMTEMSNFNSSDSLTLNLICEYDGMNNLSKIMESDANKNITSRTTNKYDGRGNVIEKCDYNSDNVLTAKTVYSYNENDFCSEIYCYNALDSLERKIGYQYKYDLKGNWIEKIDFLNGNAIKIIEREIEYY